MSFYFGSRGDNTAELLECVSCALHHQCVKLSDPTAKCAYCSINYSFVACKPMLLHCQHHLCADCLRNVQEPYLNCQICNLKIQSSHIVNKTAEFTVKANLDVLFRNFKDRFNDSLALLKGKLDEFLFLDLFYFYHSIIEKSAEFITAMKIQKQQEKDNIDLLADYLKQLIEDLRNESLRHLDIGCIQLMK